MAVNETHAKFTGDDWTIEARLIESRYPDFSKVFKTAIHGDIDINRKITIRTVIRSAKGIQWLSFFVPDIFYLISIISILLFFSWVKVSGIQSIRVLLSVVIAQQKMSARILF